MSEYVLRAAVADDIPALVDGRIRMFEDMAAFAGDTFDPELSERLRIESTEVLAAGWGVDHHGWLVEHDGLAVASAMVTIQPWLPHPRYPSGSRPYFHSVSTREGHRGHGLARRLTEAAIEWASGEGYTHVALHASAQGQPIYEALGFARSNEWLLALSPTATRGA